MKQKEKRETKKTKEIKGEKNTQLKRNEMRKKFQK